MTKSKLDLSGFEEYLTKIANAGKDVDEICVEALNAGGQIIYDGMVVRAPNDTGYLEHRIEIKPAVSDGNFHYVEIGLFNIDREHELYFFYQENGSPKNKPHPFIRPAFDEDMKRARAKMKEILKNRGAI
jgi:HK97 gp10 family phage protein